MADSSAKSSNKKKKKRKQLTSLDEKQRPPKTHRVSDEQEKEKVMELGESSKQNELNHTIEAAHPWRNLQLILSLQNKEIDLQKKVELAFSYVNLRATEEANEVEEEEETVKLSQLVVFLNDWIQSLLISTDKKMIIDSGVIVEACLDYRCWVIFKFCLEKSLRFQVSLSLSRNLLRTISCLSSNALSLLMEASVDCIDLVFNEGSLNSVVSDCVSMVFSSHGGLSNQNVELWISTVRVVLELACKIYDENLEGGNAGSFSLRFCCLVLEPFAKFLKVHPTRKNGFRDFIDELLGPLLHLLGILHLRFNGSNPSWMANLLRIVEEVFSQGVFHSVHVDGFLSLHSTEKYSASGDGNVKDSKIVNKSYHKHLFDKLERIMTSKKEAELSGLGKLFHLLVDRVKKQKAAPMSSEEARMAGKPDGSMYLSADSPKMLQQSSSAPLENSYVASNLTSEKRKSLFDFFVQIMEPLFLEMKSYLQSELEIGPLLFDVCCTLKSINHLLVSFSLERLYIKTEDISEGAFLNFLKKIYTAIFSFSTNLLRFSINDIDSGTQETLTLLANELLIALRYLLDIEYEVIGNDLTSLWLMVLSYLALGHSFKDAPNQCLLTSQILGFGCQLVKLYSELRQVENTICALCKAIRLVTVHKNNHNGDWSYGCFGSSKTSLPYEAFAKAVEMMLCAQEFKLAIHDGIKSIPEGQASECIRQLSEDLSESLEWMKSINSVADAKEFQESNTRSCKMSCFDLQAELFGRGFSEIYALVLDSLTVTSGNSTLLGKSLKDLMAVSCPSMSILVGLQPNSVNEFLSFITGKPSHMRPDVTKHKMPKLGVSTHWVFVFFFRLYMSSRSLYRQAIALMPPDKSRKMSAVMWDSFTAYSGKDLMERTNWTNDSYFSSVLQPSASLLVVIKSVSDNCPQGSNADCSPLIYIFHAMALQRLNDLNRQIKYLDYIRKSIDSIIEVNLLDDASLSQYCKRNRKWGRHLSCLKEEAEGLAEYIMSHLSLLGNDRISVQNLSLATDGHALVESDEWDLGVCSVNKKSLPTAIWWIVCQNIDIWSIHARKKKLKIFLSHVIRTGISLTTRDFTVGEGNKTGEAGFLNKITVHQISSELLINSILYEHNFVRRHLASRFCHLLKNSVLAIFNDFSIMDVDINSFPNWQEVLSTVGSLPMAILESKHVTFDELSEERPISPLSSKIAADNSMESPDMKFRACQSLLKLLCWLPKGYMNSRSFSIYVTYLLNLERYIISSISECTGAMSSYNLFELLRLLISCRRALKYLVMALSEEKTITSHSSVTPVLSEGLFSVLWLFKSVFMVVGLQETFSKDDSDEIGEMIFSLMDHTSYLFLELSKHSCTCAIRSIISKEPHKEQTNVRSVQEVSTSNESDSRVDSWGSDKGWKNILVMAESLKEQTQGLLIYLKDALCNEKLGNGVDLVNLNNLSSMVSWISGFLWGVSSALNHTNKIDSDKVEILKLNFEPSSQIGLCINVFTDFISFILHKYFVEDDRQRGSSFDVQNVEQPSDRSNWLGSEDTLNKGYSQTDDSGGAQSPISIAAENCLTASTIDDNIHNGSMQRKSSNLEEATVASVLSQLDNYKCESLNNYFLQSLLDGDHPEAAILIRQLLIASSALLKLNLQTNCTTSLSSLVPSFFGISHVLLLKLADVSEVPQPFSLIWLDGVLKYLQELGSHFPSKVDSTSTVSVYTRLVELHLNALGKCITLQGKEATLASHEMESSSKILSNNKGSSESSFSHTSFFLDEFKARLRMSLKVLISKSIELHMFPAIQAIERALVGVQEGCTMIYEIKTGTADGGKVSSTVAAGIDCLDLVLEYISGGRQSSVVRGHIQKLVAALFNIIVHLQSSLVFYVRPTGSVHNGPDPGAVILMCVEVVTRISGKRALQMASWHVAQSLHVPAALFQDFSQLRLSKGPPLPDLFLDNQDCDPVMGKCSSVVDRKFSVELYAACCRLLYTTLKHQKRESEKCIAVLQNSARVLLHCLETVDNDLRVRKGYYSWGAQEGVKCACALRRIYEELRHHKDDFGQHCFKFLSDYIWVYSGYGPLKTGIRREMDEALKPGVYALIDACSVDDLQYLHSVFGEGPCRNTLAVLQHDYKLNFQYEGKV
eukprot:XP_015580921.1 uncharacterized protein LOC8285148 [Ricinus communis]